MIRKYLFSSLIVMASMTLSGLVQADSVQVKNRAGFDVLVKTFNGDDGLCATPFATWQVNSGEDGSVDCFFNGRNQCRLLVSTTDDSANPFDIDPGARQCTSGVTSHSCGSRDVVNVQNKQTLMIDGDNCEFPVADREVRMNKQQLPVPGGDVSECLWNTQTGTILSNSAANVEWQSDGNLVVYSKGSPIWASNTQGNGDRLCFQGDGNLVIYKNGLPTWSTGTNPSGWFLNLQTDCNMTIRDIYGKFKWGIQAFCN